ncbi:MAG: porin family protein [Tannerella sp.]|jgi:hypothetical protein|nr:porin family protein [Tannerella sp.]
MRKIFYIVSICIPAMFDLGARDISLSFHYFYMGAKGKYALHIPKSLDSHGMGVRADFHLKNNFYLLADAGYYFDSHDKTNITSYSSVESYLSGYSADINLACRMGNATFCVLPYIGAGFFDEYSQQRLKSSGAPSSGGIGISPPIGGPFDVIDKYHSASIVGNIGFAVEYSVNDKIFVTGGLKYMIDLYNLKYSAFPCLNVGLGYRFRG